MILAHFGHFFKPFSLFFSKLYSTKLQSHMYRKRIIKTCNFYCTAISRPTFSRVSFSLFFRNVSLSILLFLSIHISLSLLISLSFEFVFLSHSSLYLYSAILPWIGMTSEACTEKGLIWLLPISLDGFRFYIVCVFMI